MKGKIFNVPNSGSIFAAGGGNCFGGITDGAFGMATGMAALRGACGAGFFRGLFCWPRLPGRPAPACGDKPSSVLDVWLSESESSPIKKEETIEVFDDKHFQDVFVTNPDEKLFAPAFPYA